MEEFPDNMFHPNPMMDRIRQLEEANHRLTETGAGLTKNAQDFWNRIQLQQQDIEALINAARTKDEQITYLKGILELAHGQLESWKEKARELQTIGKDLENRLSNQTNVSVSPMTDERPWPSEGSIVQVLNPHYAVQNIYFYVLAVGPSTYTWPQSGQTTTLSDGQYLVIGVKQIESEETQLRDGVDWDIIRFGIESATGPDSKFGNYISLEKPLE
tara:strand:- start:295 stop:942 length:648 start_codon:yes stop_codon:yes gene_type:complete